MNSRTGHFVQIWRPIVSHGREPEYVVVEGRTVAKSVRARNPYWDRHGWAFASRELPKNRATLYAKAYRRAGIRSRVVFRGNDMVVKIIKEYEVK